MIEIWHFLWIIPLCLGLGTIYSKIVTERNRKCGGNRKVREKADNEIADEKTDFEKEIDPMSLRNGYKVTRDKNPTFAEQWVNIMNYSGESQTEGDYEETEGDYSAEDME